MPRCSMYGTFTYIWVIFGVNVGKYSIHGAYGMWRHRSSKPTFWASGVNGMSHLAPRRPPGKCPRREQRPTGPAGEPG